MRKFTLVNTQKIRSKLILQLQGLFDLAVYIAKDKEIQVTYDSQDDTAVEAVGLDPLAKIQQHGNTITLQCKSGSARSTRW
jgi:hypothetical protein